jgi:hypothetical protein
MKAPKAPIMTNMLIIHDKNNKYLSTSVLIKVKPESSIFSNLLTMVKSQSPTNLYLDESTTSKHNSCLKHPHRPKTQNENLPTPTQT